MDAILGGVGFYAIMRGFNHARKKYKKGDGDLVIVPPGFAIPQSLAS